MAKDKFNAKLVGGVKGHFLGRFDNPIKYLCFFDLNGERYGTGLNADIVEYILDNHIIIRQAFQEADAAIAAHKANKESSKSSKTSSAPAIGFWSSAEGDDELYSLDAARQVAREFPELLWCAQGQNEWKTAQAHGFAPPAKPASPASAGKPSGPSKPSPVESVALKALAELRSK